MLIYESCRNVIERKANCADGGIFQANAIKSHKNSSKHHRNPWWLKPAPLTWSSPSLGIHLGCTMKKDKNGDMTVLPPQDCLPSSNPNMWTNLVVRRNCDPMPGSHMNHWVMLCSCVNQPWMDSSMSGSQINLWRNLFQQILLDPNAAKKEHQGSTTPVVL